MAETQVKENCQREIQVEIPADVVSREADVVIQKFQRVARLPGFRKGKVPASVIRSRFSEEIKTEVAESLIPRFFHQEAERQGLHPVSQPRVTELHVNAGEPLRFKAAFEVLPTFEVAGYEDIRVEKPDVTVTEEEVQNTLQQLREQHASYNAVEDRALQDGDFAQVAFRGTPQGTEGQPVAMEDVMVEVGGANTLPGFTQNLRGATAGEERSFQVTYPQDFSDNRLAGKKFDYSVSIKAIKQKVLPELNDDLAKEAGFSKLEELTQRVREDLLAEKTHRAEHEGKDKIVDELLKRNDFLVPESLVERQVDVRLERGLRALAAQGMTTEALKRMDLSRLRAGQHDAAQREVKVSLLLEKIAERENIEVGEEEMRKEVEAIAKQAKQPLESVRARLTEEGGLTRIRSRLRSEKTLEFLYRRSA